MSKWNQLDMDAKISQILDFQYNDPSHHFRRPFLTPYQIAIRFEKQFPKDFQMIGKPIGGKGTGQQHSLAQYIARELSQRIKKGTITNIKGKFLHCANLRKLEFKGNNGQLIESSLKQANDLSIFRLID